MCSKARLSQTTGLSILLLIASLSHAEPSATSAEITDYQRMSWLFYLANRDSIPTSIAAVHFGLLHSDVTDDSDQCSALKLRPVEEATEIIEQHQNKFGSLKSSVSPGQLSQSFTALVPISNAYHAFDPMTHSLILRGFDQLQKPFIVNSLTPKSRQESKALRCTNFSVLQTHALANTATPMPGRFRIDFYSALLKAITTEYHSTTLHDLLKSSRLNRVPLDAKLAQQLLNRLSLDQIMDMQIDYRFHPRRPFVEIDALGRRNQLIRVSDTNIEFTLPTHTIDITRISYIDRLSGRTLGSVSFEEPLAANRVNDLPDVPPGRSTDESLSTLYTQNTNLPKNLRTHNNAIVVRADDLVFHKTPAENRLALTKLNQLLALSAGLPDFSDVQNGIYVADILGPRAANYFTMSDMRTVQPQTYNILLDGADQGLHVAVKWRDELPKDNLLRRFNELEIPALREISLNFPIDFVELREVLLLPYDLKVSGFPLMLVNGGSNMHLNDLRKPTIKLNAKLPGVFPRYWKLNPKLAELFVEHYYRFHTDSDSINFLANLKRLTLASYFRMLSVSANNGTVLADMRLLRRSLHLSDDLNEKLVELPVSP